MKEEQTARGDTKAKALGKAGRGQEKGHNHLREKEKRKGHIKAKEKEQKGKRERCKGHREVTIRKR